MSIINIPFWVNLLPNFIADLSEKEDSGMFLLAVFWYLVCPWESSSCLTAIEKEDWSPSKDTLSKQEVYRQVQRRKFEAYYLWKPHGFDPALCAVSCADLLPVTWSPSFLIPSLFHYSVNTTACGCGFGVKCHLKSDN